MGLLFCPSEVRGAQATRCLVSALSQLGNSSYHLPGPAPRIPGCTMRALSQVCCVSPLGSWSLTETVLVDVIHPGSWEIFISKWEAAHNLVEDAIAGAKIAPPLPVCLFWGEGPVHSRLALLWYSLNALFCEQTMLCFRAFSGKIISLSLSLFFFFFFLLWLFPQFGSVSPVSSLRLSSGHSGLVPTLWVKPTPPCSAPAHCWQTPVSCLPLRWELRLAAWSVGSFFFFFFSSRLCCPLRFQNSPQTYQWEGFLVFGKFSSFMTPSLGWISIPNSFVSVFIFYIFPYLLLKRMGCLSGCLVSSTSIQNLFSGSCLAFKWSFNEFVGEKVVSLSYSSAILGPPPFIPLFDWVFCFSGIERMNCLYILEIIPLSVF